MVLLQYDDFTTQEHLKAFLALLKNLSKKELKDQLPDLTNRIFEANKDYRRPSWVFDKKPYVKIIPEATLVATTENEQRKVYELKSCTKNLSVQIRSLTDLSDSDCALVRTLCDGIYTYAKKESEANMIELTLDEAQKIG